MPLDRESSPARPQAAPDGGLRGALEVLAFLVGGLSTNCDRGRIDLETRAVGLEGGAAESLGDGAGAQPEGSSSVRPDRYFPDDGWMYRDISGATVHARSNEMTGCVGEYGGLTEGGLKIDFTLTILNAGTDAVARAFEPTGDFFPSDCDRAAIPLPPGGALQGESGYECLGGGECHLIVVDRPHSLLFEQWRANVTASRFEGGCLALWDMLRVYPPEGRGEQCTSADAAGLPLAPLLFTEEEVALGNIEHALRFYVQSSGIAPGKYVRPATHGGAASGTELCPAYGARFRLHSDFDMTRLSSPAAVTIARALQRYGMALVGTGSVAVFAASDRLSVQRWGDLLSADSLDALRASDFDVIDTGEPIPLTYDCVR